MGIFDIFKGKNKEKDIAEARKKIIDNKLENLKSRIPVDQFDLIREIQNVINDLNNQPLSTDPKVLYSDALINSIIADINNDLTKGYYCVMEVRIDALKDALQYRANITTENGVSLSPAKQARIDKAAQKELAKEAKNNKLEVEDIKVEAGAKYSNEQLYDINLSMHQDEVFKVEADIKKLTKKQEAGTFNQADAAKYQLKQRELQIKQNSLNAKANAATRDATLKMMEQFNEEQKENISQYSDAEMELIKQQYTSTMQTISQGDGLGDLFGETSGASFGVGVSNTTQAKTFNPAEYATLQADVKKLEEGLNEYNKTIQKSSMELTTIGNQVIMLDEKRKSADNATKLTLDSQIKTLKTKYMALQNKIRLLEQNRIQLGNNLSLASGLLNKLEVQQMNQKYSGMSMANIEKMAMDLRSAIEQGNDMLDQSNSSAAVGLGVDISTESYTDIGIDSAAQADANDAEIDAFVQLVKGASGGIN
ncbi:MAG: hypothetical protein K5765_06180 [Clostridia bacterium]|nr:hypothetical protein [Clostridia bacterium]